jgi:DNA invertase Pin-like site-specific DNA recombinase
MAKRAFSYARFSSSEQAEGRSLDRQLEQAAAFCKRHGYVLDEHAFVDHGVSGFHGANATHGDLGAFLELVREGRIPKGSVLIIEKLNRLSRLPPHEANAVLMDIVAAGVDIATTSPEQVFTKQNIGQLATWVPLQVAQCLAHEESRNKSDWLSDAWAAKRKTADKKILTKKGPAWLRLTADRKGWVVIEKKTTMVRRAFALADSGMGVSRIAGVLHEEYPEGLKGRGWQPGTIYGLLRSRSVIGEYQPHVGTCAKKGRKSTRKPAGDPIRNYFPAIVEEALFYRVQLAMDSRRTGGGAARMTPNLFNGVLYDARDGRRMTVNYNYGRKLLVSSGAVRRQKGSVYRGIGYDLFVRAILAQLKELTPADVLGRPGEDEDRVAVLTGRLTAVNRKLEAVRARAAQEDDVTVFLDLLADLDGQRKDLIAQLDHARAEAASREAGNVGEFVSLVKLLDDAEPESLDDLRARLRAALRRVVQSMHALVVPRGRNRLVAVQAWFVGGGRHREYVMVFLPATTSRPTLVKTLSLADVSSADSLDLRKAAHARRLEKVLADMDLPTEVATDNSDEV